MNRIAVAGGLICLAIAARAAAQSTDQTSMPGMSMPMPVAKAPATPAPETTPAKEPTPAPAGGNSMADMPGMKGMDMSGAGQGQAPTGGDMASAAGASEPEIPAGPPPPAPKDHAADRYYAPAAMAAARATLRQEHGGAALSQVMANLAEYQARPGGGGYRWDGEAWFGGDINKFVLTSEGEGSVRQGLNSAELQALYARAVTPYFDLHAGVRQDFAPLGRTYATVGFQGLAPYWLDIQGALFLSTRGELLGRLEGTYDLRLTQRLILQPRAELNLAAQDTPQTQTGSGLSTAELGLRLRYEVRREFAPYIGISYDQKVGRTADFARARGEDPAAASLVVGIRAWF
ncbi:MAG: copper resistance protein CopB [Caulobacteraceae bacterium]|nr:copper resistance protein CopB [Caulobacteraceae bacterium]